LVKYVIPKARVFTSGPRDLACIILAVRRAIRLKNSFARDDKAKSTKQSAQNSNATTTQARLPNLYNLVNSPLGGIAMAHQHSPGFLRIVNDAKKRVQETTVSDVKAKLDRGEKFLLIDVREESEYAKDHLPDAVHLGKGIIERDIEERVPDHDKEMILYCGGGFRSALAADNLQKMGYTRAISMDGGIREWRERAFPLVKG
jgi:rhodanese-related sulfurtransferase